MLGLRTILKTKSNKLQIRIPDALKDLDLEIIILPLSKDRRTIEYEFWSDEDLRQIGKLDLSKPFEDKEDFSKW